MIRKIRIKNVQSHRESELEFSPGVNAIVGSSNNGKSAVLRALYWCRYNRPLGTDTLLSHWAFDKKGNQLGEMAVEVECAGGTVSRVRTKTENKYVVCGKELEAVKSDVPEEVEACFRLNDTNFQRQQDAPFLLSLTNGQVAAYFNKVVRLDVIDRVLANAESERRRCNAEIKAADEKIAAAQKTLGGYGFVDECAKCFELYDRQEEKKVSFAAKLAEVEKTVAEYGEVERGAAWVAGLAGAKKLVAEYEKMCVAAGEARARHCSVTGEIESLRELEGRVCGDFTTVRRLCESVSANAAKLRELKLKLDGIGDEVNEHRRLEKDVAGWRNDAAKNRKLLPRQCPLCGAEMKGGEE